MIRLFQIAVVLFIVAILAPILSSARHTMHNVTAALDPNAE